MKLARSLALWLAVVAVVGLVLPADEASAQKRGGTLVMLVQPEPPTLASYISTSGPIGQVTSKIYEGLLEYDFSLKPIPGLAESWRVEPRRQDHHLHAAEGREVPRRQAVHQRRREVLRPRGAQEDASARAGDLPRGHRDRHARRAHRDLPARGAGALSADGAVGLRVADAAEAPLRGHRHQGEQVRQRAGGHRAVQVRGVAARSVHPARPQPRLLEAGAAIPRPYRGPLRRRLGHPHRGHREGGGPRRRLRRDPLARRQDAGQAPHHRDHDEGLRDVVAHRPARLQHPQGALRQPEGPPGRLLCREPQGGHRERVVRVGQARHGPDQLELRPGRLLHVRRSTTTTSPTASRPPTSCSTTPASSAGPAASASRSSTISRRTARSGSATASTCSRCWPSSASRPRCATRTWPRG